MPIGYEQTPSGPVEQLFRWISKQGSKLTPNTTRLFADSNIRGFTKAQRLAYDCVEHVEKQLYVGMSEKEAAQLLADYLKEKGCNRFIHRPFAWFGDHTRFDGYDGYADYHPSDRLLEKGDVVILDVSPVVDGYTADVGYSVSLEANPDKEKALDFLRELRAELPPLFLSDLTPSEIWNHVDWKIANAGYDNIHARYPFCVLGHRVFKLQERRKKSKRWGTGAMSWFSMEVNLKFLKTGFSSVLTPENVGNKTGLWAIEPHIGWSGAGAKFEEILVVTDNDAYWLDDNVPHVKLAQEDNGNVKR